MSTSSSSMSGDFCPIFSKEGRRAVILCDGPPPPAELLDYWLAGADLFVCTDAAGHPYDDLPRVPDVVIGDFDSLTGRILSGKFGPRYLLVREQETTDSEKALLYVIEQDCTEAVMLGATGWRLDHTLYNCHLLHRYADQLRICLVGYQPDIVRVAAGKTESWQLTPGTGFSLLPLVGDATGVTLTGALFPLTDATIHPGGRATISNRVIETPLSISLASGSVLVAVNRGANSTSLSDSD
ncbi:MAG: thiamine diphosphokinase [bacterium]